MFDYLIDNRYTILIDDTMIVPDDLKKYGEKIIIKYLNDCYKVEFQKFCGDKNDIKTITMEDVGINIILNIIHDKIKYPIITINYENKEAYYVNIV